MKKKIISFLLAMIMSVSQIYAYSAKQNLTDGLIYYETFVPNEDGGGYQTHIIDYYNYGSVTPVVVYGSKLYGRSTLNELENYMDSKDISPIAAINGDFFTLSTGIPEGLTITEGVMRSSDSYQNAVGITEKGDIFIGTPQLKMDLIRNDGYTVSVTYFNKTRTNQGVYLLNSDFSAETRISNEGINILLKKLDGNEVKIGSEVKLLVEDIYESEVSEKIPDGHMILTVDNTGPKDKIADLKIGDELVFSVTSQDSRWNNAYYSIGAGEYLLKNGEYADGLSTANKPCTAVGIRTGSRNGNSYMFIAVDGRQEGSDGISPADLAGYMRGWGCAEAVLLDGGGSTTSAVNYIGTPYLTVTNSPSDGTPRKCANYIVFKNNLENTGELNSLHIYPSNEFALPGAQVTFTAGGADSGKHYVELSEKPVYYAADGMISENIYTTPLLPGKYSVSAGYQNLSTSSEIEVVDSVDRIVPSKKTIYLKPMETIDLTVSAYYENRAVALMDSNFTWECDDIGSIDENGCFTATRALSRTGKITVSYGDTSAEIKVVVLSDLPVKKLPKPFLPLG